MVIRTTIFYSLLSFWTLFLGLLCFPFLLFPSQYLRFPTLIWIKGIFLFLKYVCEITHEIRGIENIPDEPVIIVSKHQSAFETFALFYYFKNSFFIHKKQLFFIPIFAAPSGPINGKPERVMAALAAIIEITSESFS